MALHKALITDDLHSLVFRQYANAAARTGDGTLTAGDNGKLVHQTDNDSFYLIIDGTSPTFSGNLVGAASGEANLATNVGTGAGGIFRDKAGVTLNLKTILAGVGITVTNNANEVEIAGPIFGRDYQHVVSAARTTTTSNTFVDKLSMVTPALTGDYRVAWRAVIDHSSASDRSEFRLQNVTDAVTVGATIASEPKDPTNRLSMGGYDIITFAGVAKTFTVQFRQVNGTTAGIQDVHIELWRVG